MILLYSIVNGVLQQGSFAFAFNYISASLVSLHQICTLVFGRVVLDILSDCFNVLAPLFSLILSIIMKEEKLTILRILSIVFCLCGGVLLVRVFDIIAAIQQSQSFDSSELIGMAIITFHQIVYAIGRVVMRVFYSLASNLSIVYFLFTRKLQRLSLVWRPIFG